MPVASATRTAIVNSGGRSLSLLPAGLGMCKGTDFANTLGPWIVTPDELSNTVVAGPEPIPLPRARAGLHGSVAAPPSK